MAISSVIVSAYSLDTSARLFIEHPSAGSQIGDNERRVARTQTLDGSVAFVDGGFVDGDRTIRLEVAAPSDSQLSAAKRYIELYTQVRVATCDGSFLCRPSAFRGDLAGFALTLFVQSKLSA